MSGSATFKKVITTNIQRHKDFTRLEREIWQERHVAKASCES